MSPRLFVAIVALEARVAMSYRVNFWIAIVAAPITELAVAYCLWTSIFATTGASAVAGLGLPELLRYYVAAILVGRLTQGREFDDGVMSEIYQGGLNRYIVFPAAYGPIKYAQHLGSLAPYVVQVAVLAAAAHFLVPDASLFGTPLGRVGMAAGSIALANVMAFALSFPIHCVAFWADNVWSLLAAKRFALTLLGGLWFPLAVFPAEWQRVIAWLPFRHLYDAPARALLGQASVVEWAQSLAMCAAWTVICVVVGALVWRSGRRRYTGVGM